MEINLGASEMFCTIIFRKNQRQIECVTRFVAYNTLFEPWNKAVRAEFQCVIITFGTFDRFAVLVFAIEINNGLIA